jgi:hypothetical protein
MLVNKRCTSGDINLLRFLFPRYDLITEFNIPENPCRPAIYCGDYSYIDLFIQKYQESHVDFIVMAYKSDINLDDRRVLANIIFEKWRNATLPKYLEQIIDDIPQEEFIEMVKIKWVSGKWMIKKIADENNFLTMIEELNKSKFEFIKAYFKCLEENKPHILESSILTFLQKAKDKSYVGNSFQYRKKLEMYKGAKLDKTLDAINNALDYNIDNQELRLLNILMNIQDSNKLK